MPREYSQTGWTRNEHLYDAFLSGFGVDERADLPSKAELEDYGIGSLADLRDAFYNAFVDLDIDTSDRSYWREVWFDFMDSFGYDFTDFDWDSWREWYDSA